MGLVKEETRFFIKLAMNHINQLHFTNKITQDEAYNLSRLVNILKQRDVE